jgi:protein TonB
MEKSNILSADLIDILFDGRNKSYGAYDLRKTYDKRIRYSIGGTFFVCLLFIVGSLLAGGKKKHMEDMLGPTIELTQIPPEEKEKIEPPKEKPKEQPPVETAKVTPPRIVQDDQVDKKDEIVEVTKLDDAKIGTINITGEKFTDEVAPPVEGPTGISKKTLRAPDPEDEIMPIVQIEAQYPGGMGAWRKFLERNLNRDTPGDNGAPAGNYKVIVSFVVDKEGNLSDIVAENDPGYGTKEEAIKAIVKSQKWTPAFQNGRNVKYRQKQAITFTVTAD